MHDPAFAGSKTAVRSINVPLTSLSIVILEVKDLPQLARGRTLGAHVHTRACSADAAASGPHHANPAASPALSLASREVWLDLNIDGSGRGMAIALFDWRIKKGDAGSVVIHADPTNAVTGAAGARVLCTAISLGD